MTHRPGSSRLPNDLIRLEATNWGLYTKIFALRTTKSEQLT